MQNFTIFILVLTLGVLQTFSFFREYFDDSQIQKIRHKLLVKQFKQKELKYQLAEYEFQEFRQLVAKKLPQLKINQIKKEDLFYQKRRIASLVVNPSHSFGKLDFSNGVFQQGKKFFKQKLYKEAEKSFKKMVDEYSYSANILESYFLLMEAQFLIKNFPGCLDTIDKMLTLFPGSDLTGLALLRMGEIFESKDRMAEALDVYRTIFNAYSSKSLKDKVTKRLNILEI